MRIVHETCRFKLTSDFVGHFFRAFRAECWLPAGMRAEERSDTEPASQEPHVALVRYEHRRRVILLRRYVPVVQLRPIHQTILVQSGRGRGSRGTGARRPVHGEQRAGSAKAVGVKIRTVVRRRDEVQTVFGERRQSVEVGE